MPQTNSYDAYYQAYIEERERRRREETAIVSVPVPSSYAIPPSQNPQESLQERMYREIYGGMPLAVPQQQISVPTPALHQRGTIAEAQQPWYLNAVPSLDDDIFTDAATSPVLNEPHHAPHRWPVGTIVKWDFSVDAIQNHIRDIGGNTNNPLIKICQYNSSGEIQSFQWYGEVEIANPLNYSPKYFCDASPSEVQAYEKALADLKQCQTMPAIGTVLKYIGNDGGIKGSRAVVKAQYRLDRINVQWVSGRHLGSTGQYNFNLWQIARDQSGSFVPNPADHCNCEFCGSMRPLNNVRMVGNHKYCGNDCAVGAGNGQCGCCGEWKTNGNLNENNVCGTCHEQFYRLCCDCGAMCNSGIMRPTTAGLQCDHCRRALNTLVHSYDYKPPAMCNKMVWENTRYLGVELEIEGFEHDENEHVKFAEKIRTWLKQQAPNSPMGDKLKRAVYIKNDGSLEDGMEIVLHPFTLKAFHAHFPLKGFMEFLNEYNAEISDRCGMHVHVSKEKISTASLVRGRWFFWKCMPFLKKFSGRNNFRYCEFEQQVPYKDPLRQDFGRRSALNLCASPKTLEIRIFAGTLDYRKFMANLQFSDAFVDYIQHGCGSAFLRTKTGNQIWIDFIDYCKKNGQWRLFTNYVLTKGIV